MYPTVTMPEMLKIPEAARIFKVGAYTLRLAVQTGKLRGYTPNGHAILLRADQVQEWIESQPYETHIDRRVRAEVPVQ